MHTIDETIALLGPDPVNVGADEYTTLHEGVSDALRCYEPEEDEEYRPQEYAAAILNEYIAHAAAMLKNLAAEG